MDSDERTALIEAVHATPVRAVIVTTGGGATAVAELLAVPGASRTVLEAVVPYSSTALVPWLDGSDGSVSAATATEMAVTAAQRARVLQPDGMVTGVACTAALATDRDRRGADRAHLAIATPDGPMFSLDLDLERRDGRAVQERAVSDAVLEMVAAACGADPSVRG